MNIYYELPADQPEIVRYWVKSITYIYKNYNMLGQAVRVWAENGDQLSFIKNRYKGALVINNDDLTIFRTVKSLARNVDMMTIRKFSDGVMYIAFPVKGYNGAEYLIPEGIEEWLVLNTKPQWGIVKDQRTGVFLSEQDATAFKLRWL